MGYKQAQKTKTSEILFCETDFNNFLDFDVFHHSFSCATFFGVLVFHLIFLAECFLQFSFENFDAVRVEVIKDLSLYDCSKHSCQIFSNVICQGGL